jgi:hypothetical protein
VTKVTITETGVALNLDVRTAAAVRQVLFDSQKGYTYDETSIPPRIIDIRGVIVELDSQIEKHTL